MNNLAIHFIAEVAEENCYREETTVDPAVRNYNFTQVEGGKGLKVNLYRVPKLSPDSIPHYGETWEVILTPSEGEGSYFLTEISTQIELEAFTVNKLFSFRAHYPANSSHIQLYVDLGEEENISKELGKKLRVGTFYDLTLRRVNLEEDSEDNDEKS